MKNILKRILLLCLTVCILTSVSSCNTVFVPEETGTKQETTQATSTEETTPEVTTPETTTPEVTTPEETTVQDLYTTYTVIVVDENNAPLKGAVVQLYVGGVGKLPVLTNEEGKVSIITNRGNHTVKVTLAGYSGKPSYTFAAGKTELTICLSRNIGTTTPEVTTPAVTTPQVTTPEATTPEEITPPTPEEKVKIYIDQGHNPSSWNLGAEGNGLKEQNLTFEIGMLLYELLSKDDRFEVRLSRPTVETVLGNDNNSSLDFRINDAKAWGADYFISLHINAYSASSATGLEVYSASWDRVGYAFGEKILNALVEATNLRDRGMKDGDHLRVLKKAGMPAVLVEMGFITNAEDAALLDKSPELFAQGVYNGILSYFKISVRESDSQ